MIILILGGGLCGIEDDLKGERLETVAQTRIELALKFHPET